MFKNIFQQFTKLYQLYPDLEDLSDIVSKSTQKIYKSPDTLLIFNNSLYRQTYKTWGQLGLFDSAITPLQYGIINYNIEKLDSALRSAYSVQSSLVIKPIETFANDSTKNKFLPSLYSGEHIGCFGLTEPQAGSDPSSVRTLAKRHKDYYIVNGGKTWITNSPVADTFVIWCKDEDGKIIGLVSERTDQMKTPPITEKMSLYASPTGSIFFDDLKVPVSQRLNVEGLKGPFVCLNKARYGISWGVLGAMDNCLEIATDYLNERKQFGKSLSSNQLVQKDISTCVYLYHSSLNNSLASLELIKTFDELEKNTGLISFLKKNNCESALQVARISRDLLGGNGVSNAYHIMRHLVNLEAVNTYEGARNIHDLIIGRYMFGKSAF